MAVSHFLYNSEQLKTAFSHLDQGVTQLRELRDAMIQMKDGGNFTQYICDRFGFPEVATAASAFAELDALLGKIDTDGDVNAVKSGIAQAIAKFLKVS